MRASSSRRLTPTYEHPKASEWGRVGGPWDVPPLDHALTTPPHLDAQVARLAGALRAAGVASGDTVAWQRPNGPDALHLFRACWRIGAVAAPIHHLAGRADLAVALGLLAPRLFIGADEPLPGAGRPVPQGSGRVAPGDVAVALCTSGSTGTPKVVLHTHRGLAYKSRVMAQIHGLGPGDRVLMPAPLAHIAGVLNGVVLPAACGAEVTLMTRWHPRLALERIERDRVTFMAGPPTFFVSLIEAETFAPRRVASLRLVSCGGAGVTPAFVERASQALGCRVKRTYGSTEAPTITTSYAEDPPRCARDTDGRPTGEAEIAVVDPATGGSVDAGAVGELLVRGPELFVGYADDAVTATAFTSGGWFRTGDLAAIDPEGWLTVAGRLKEVIIRGGENIATAEIESVLEAHPQVRQAAAIGEPDDRLGERVCAFVVAARRFDLEACTAWFAARGLARFKWPERVVRLPELPLLPSGKPDRVALRAMIPERGFPA